MESPALLVRAHLKGTYLFLIVLFLGLIYFVSGKTIWLLAYPLACLLLFYFVFLHEERAKLNFWTKVLLFLNPLVFGLILLYFLAS